MGCDSNNFNPREYLMLFQSGLLDTSGVSKRTRKHLPRKPLEELSFWPSVKKCCLGSGACCVLQGPPTNAFWPSVGCTPAGDRGGLNLNPLLLLGEAAESLYLIICPVERKKFLNDTAAALFLPFWGYHSLVLYIYFKNCF